MHFFLNASQRFSNFRALHFQQESLGNSALLKLKERTELDKTNMRLVFACCEVPRHLWEYDVLVPVPHVIDETQILMPRYLKVMKAPPKMKDASEKKAPPVMKASPETPKVAKAMVALKKVMKAPAAMKAGGKGMKTKAMKTEAMKTKAMKTKANKAVVKAKTMKKIYKKPSRK